MPTTAPPSTPATGEQILTHICSVSGCTTRIAAKYIQLAISNGALRPTFNGSRWPALKWGHPALAHLTPPGEKSGPATSFTKGALWAILQHRSRVRADGKIKFGPTTPWQDFEAEWNEVLTLWPQRP